MVMNTVTQFSLGKVKALPTTSTLKSRGHRRIKRCNGTVGFILFRHPCRHGYVTVTTDSSGNIISDVSEKWEHDHCSPVSSPYTRLNRDWNNAQYPFYFKHLQVAHSREHLADTDTLPTLYARAPPLR